MAQRLNPATLLDNLARQKDSIKEIFENVHVRFGQATNSMRRSSSTDVQDEHEELDEVLNNYNMDRLKMMLEAGAPILHKSGEENFAMNNAAFYARVDIIKLIIKRYQDEKLPNSEEEFKSQATDALLEVCSVNSGEIAGLLIDAGAEIYREQHLHQAAENGSRAVLEEMFKRMANVEKDIDTLNNDGQTPLHCAIMGKHLHTVQYLLDKKANVNITTDKGLNSIHLACQHADENILYLLITRGGDVNAIDDDEETPTMVAAQNGKDGCISILAAAGANLDMRDKEGHVPLITAAQNGHTNTVKELILNGASFDVPNNTRYNALEEAIISKKDATAAIIIRLAPQEDFMKHFLATNEIGLLKIVQLRLKETLKALLDRMLVQVKPSNPHFGEVRTKYLETDSDKQNPNDPKYQKNKTFFLQRLAGFGDEDVAYNGTVRVLVDRKMIKFGNWVLSVKLLTNILFLLALAYSLIQASYENAPRDAYSKNGANIFRILTELFVFVYFVFNILTEGVEFFRVARLTYRYVIDKKKKKEDEKKRDETVDTHTTKKISIKSKLYNIIAIRIIVDYFSDKSNYLDVIGLSTLLILMVLRIARQPSQWVFATITFFVNSLRLFKLITLIPYIGPYANIFYKILKKDVLQFLTLFAIFLFIFTGTYFIALRTPYTSEGFRNVSLNQNTVRVQGVDNSVEWVFISGMRILLEGNLYQDDSPYVYNHLNWLAAIVYISFLFLTVVVFLNIFIAQLSETYGEVKKNAERAFAWQRLNFIVQIQRTSLLSILFDIRKKYFIDNIKIQKDEMFKYYGVYSVKDLNIKYFSENVEVKGMLFSIQNQQIFSRKTQEISKSPPKNLKPNQPRDKAAEEVRELNAKIEDLKESFTDAMGKLAREMNELKSSFSIETVIKMIEEKNK